MGALIQVPGLLDSASSFQGDLRHSPFLGLIILYGKMRKSVPHP